MSILTVSAIRDETGSPERIIAMIRDVTERARMEGELRDSLELLRRTDDQRRSLLGRMVRAQEDERRLVAEDIHDGPVQQMTALAIRLATILRDVDDPDLAVRLAHLQDWLGATIAEMRQLMFDLRPSALDAPGGLPESLEEILGRLEQEAGIRACLRNELVREPSSEGRAICFRIAREAIVNARKHARARHVDVALEEEEEDGVRITIVDDGAGFRPAEAEGGAGHLGLLSMRERAELAGGWFELASAPHAGTTVRFWIPLTPAG